MPLAGFEPTIPVFKWAKTFYALECAATVTDCKVTNLLVFVWEDRKRTTIRISDSQLEIPTG
jgi:hypothetical protein